LAYADVGEQVVFAFVAFGGAGGVFDDEADEGFERTDWDI
jgi:hypothetical protein